MAGWSDGIRVDVGIEHLTVLKISSVNSSFLSPFSNTQHCKRLNLSETYYKISFGTPTNTYPECERAREAEDGQRK